MGYRTKEEKGRKSSSGENSTVCLIKPILNENAELLGMIDQEGQVYTSGEELLQSEYNLFFFIEYMVCGYSFENGYKDHNFRVIFQLAPYGGTPSCDFVVPSIMKNKKGTAPRVMKSRGKYNGKTFRFFDAQSFLRGINYFDTDDAKMIEYSKVIQLEVDTFMIPTKRGQNSIAGIARFVFGDPHRMNNQDRSDFLENIRGCYRGGLYYVNKLDYQYPILYNYDIRSMYPAILNRALFFNPDKVPQLMEGFVDVDNNTQLAIYHIREIEIRRKPEISFDTMFTIEEEQARLRQLKVIIEDGHIQSTKKIPSHEGWITSIDYLTMIRDYDIIKLEINKSYIYDELVPGALMFNNLYRYFQRKEASKGTERSMGKVLIDSYSGSLGSMYKAKGKVSGLTADAEDIYDPNVSDGPVDLAAFMTAYGRYYISQLARNIPADVLQGIDTDGFGTTEPIPEIEAMKHDDLGDIRLDKIMYDAMGFGNKQYVSREDSPDAPFTPHIAGLPGFLYEPGVREYIVPQFVYDNIQKKPIYQEISFRI